MAAKKKILKNVVFYAEDHPELLALWDKWVAEGQSASDQVRQALEQVYLCGAPAVPVLGNEHAFTAADLRAIIREELQSARLSVQTESGSDAGIEQVLDSGAWEL